MHNMRARVAETDCTRVTSQFAPGMLSRKQFSPSLRVIVMRDDYDGSIAFYLYTIPSISLGLKCVRYIATVDFGWLLVTRTKIQ